MKVTFRDIEYHSDQDCSLLARWANDPLIRHLSSPHPNEEAYSFQETAASFRQKKAKPTPIKTVEQMVLWQGEPVGSIELMVDPTHKVSPQRTAWFGIVIGEAHARGRGLGKLALIQLEALSRAMGIDHVEVGTFEFNLASLALFHGQGYHEFKRIPAFTWWQGRRWADIRLAKSLSPLHDRTR